MKSFNFTKEPSELHKETIVRIEECFEDICSCSQINYRVMDRSKTWKEWNQIGHLFMERPEILAEAREIYFYLTSMWTNGSGLHREQMLREWLQKNAEPIEDDEDYDDDIDGEAYGFYLDTDLAMYAIVVDMGGACSVCPEMAIFAKDKRYLCNAHQARQNIADAAKSCGDIAYAREACYYLLAQLPDSDIETKRKLERSINTLNTILRG